MVTILKSLGMGILGAFIYDKFVANIFNKAA